MTWWNEALEVAQSESGGGGIVGKIRAEFGYKVYVAGVAQESTFFPAPAEKARGKERAEALAKAQGFLREHGVTGKRPAWALQIRVYRDTAVVRGEPVTWQHDRFFVTPTYASAFNVIAESLRDAGIETLPWEGWVRLRLINDPYAESRGEAGMTDRDADGNPRFPQIAVVAEVFPNEPVAHAAALPSAEMRDDAPPGYSVKAWEIAARSLYYALKSKEPPERLAKDYGVGLEWVLRVKQQLDRDITRYITEDLKRGESPEHIAVVYDVSVDHVLRVKQQLESEITTDVPREVRTDVPRGVRTDVPRGVRTDVPREVTKGEDLF